MLKEVIVINASKETLVMNLSKPWASNINVKNISGISPMDVEVISSKNGFYDGEKLNLLRKGSREIVFTLGLVSNVGKIEEARHKVYKYFPIKEKVSVIFSTDTNLLKIDGYVQSNETDIFSKDETSIIKLYCPDPWFSSANGSVFAFLEGAPLFEFPFSNESTDKNLIVMSEIQSDSKTVIKNEGVSTGAKFNILFGENIQDSMLNQNYELVVEYNSQIEKFVFNPKGARNFELCTEDGGKYFVNKSTGENWVKNVDILNSSWPKIGNGSSSVYVNGYSQVDISIEILITEKYEGL